MTVRIGINGYGRIGRNILRALYDSDKKEKIEIVAINDLGNAETNAHLTKYDSAYGILKENVSVDDDFLSVGSDNIKVFSERDPSKIPWKDLGVDIVHECTGFFANRKDASKHLEAGAKKVTFASASPPIRFSNVYGIDMPTRSELIAYDRSEEEIRSELGVDNLVFQELDHMLKDVLSFNSMLDGLEASCFNGNYITGGK